MSGTIHTLSQGFHHAAALEPLCPLCGAAPRRPDRGGRGKNQAGAQCCLCWAARRTTTSAPCRLSWKRCSTGSAASRSRALEPPHDKEPNDPAHLAKLADIKRADYDVLVFYTLRLQAQRAAAAALEKFVEDGGGIVACTVRSSASATPRCGTGCSAASSPATSRARTS